MIKPSTLLLVCIVLTMMPQSEGSRVVDRINQYRKRFNVAGIRILFNDQEMENKATDFAAKCKAGHEDGNLGILSIESENIAKGVDTVCRDILTQNLAHKQLDGINLSHLQLLSPKAYKIGCAENKQCTPPRVVCVLNTKTAVEDVIFMSDICEACSPTFSKCSSKICEPEDGLVPSEVPEDDKEITEKKESQASSDSINAQESSNPVESSSRAVIGSFGLLCLSNILFYMMSE